MNILEISGLSKSFGSHQVINKLDLTVPEHTVFGFIGQNGAGKTTVMKMILGLYRPDSGTIKVNGETVSFGQNKTNRYIGYLPDVPEYYNYMTPAEYLQLCGEVSGMSGSDIRKKSAELLDLVGMARHKKRIKGFSRGMKQRLGIAQALLHSPKLLICDEPTSALDPVGRKEILDILDAIRETTTVLFSTHILSDVERIADRAAFLHNGKIAMEGTTSEMKANRKGSCLEIDFSETDGAKRFLELYPDAAQASGTGEHSEGPETRILLSGKNQQDMAEIMRLLCANNIMINRIEMLEPTLEDLFMQVIKN